MQLVDHQSEFWSRIYLQKPNERKVSTKKSLKEAEDYSRFWRSENSPY